jgi:Fe-S cluster assembly protein SufD
VSPATATEAALPGEVLDRLLNDLTGWERQWIDTHGMPNPRAEAWRYTPLQEMLEVLRGTEPTIDHSHGVDRETLDSVSIRYGAVRLVFVNGRYSAELSDSPDEPEVVPPLPPGARVGPLADLLGTWLPGNGESGAAELLGRWASPLPESLDDDDGFRVLNAGGDQDPAVVMISPGVAVGSPINIVHLRTAAPAGDDLIELSQPVTLIDVGAGASVRVIETHVSLGVGFTNALSRIRVGVDAQLHHVRVQDDHPEGTHMGDTVIEAHRGSYLESTSVNLGARIARNGIDLSFLGEHATADLSGLSLLLDGERCDTVLQIDHGVPNCTSSQDFRSIVDDGARASFCGHVLVQHGAEGTDSSQSNHNLLLSRGAQADTRPWLEILTDDVRCVHGATVGQLDEDALFYMLSRGIPRESAESMLIGAFAARVIDDIDPPRLREALYARIDTLDQGAHEQPL